MGYGREPPYAPGNIDTTSGYGAGYNGVHDRGYPIKREEDGSYSNIIPSPPTVTAPFSTQSQQPYTIFDVDADASNAYLPPTPTSASTVSSISAGSDSTYSLHGWPGSINVDGSGYSDERSTGSV